MNTKDRHLEPIKGLVLCFTTSKNVEYIERNLTYSYPLYSYDPNGGQDYANGQALTFSVELDGFLSFEQGSQVKIVELAPLVRPNFDPTRFIVVAPADPVRLEILEFVLPYPDGEGNSVRSRLTYTNGAGTYTVELQSLVGRQPETYWRKWFQVGGRFLGVDGYSNVFKRAEL